MATVISNLSIRLAASANGVGTGVTQAMGYLGRLQQRVDKLGAQGLGGLKSMVTSTFGQMVSATAAINAATAIWQGTVERLGEAYERVGERSKRATQVGGETQELGRIEYVASQTTTLDSAAVFDSVRAMQNRIANASINPDDTLNQTFAQLGLSANELLQLPLEERFFAIAGAISKIGDASQRSAMTAKLFEETGSAWATGFAAGEETLRSVAAEYDRLHGVTSQLDAKGIDGVNAATGRLTTAGEGLWDALAADGSNTLGEAADSLTDLTVQVREFSGYIAELGEAWLWQPVGISGTVLWLGEAAGWWQESSKYAEQTKQNAEAIAAANENSLVVYAQQQAAAEAAAKADEERVKAAEKLAADRERAEQQTRSRLESQAQSLKESLRDPFEELAAELVSIQDVFDEGLLGTEDLARLQDDRSKELLDRLVAEGKAADAKSATKPDSPLGSTAYGSQAAASAIAAADAQHRQRQQAEQIAARQRERTNRILEKIATVLDDPRRALETAEVGG